MSKQNAGINETVRLLGRAQKAVNRGDPVEMLEALTASGYLDGLRRRLQADWGSSLPPSEVDECVARAVDAASASVFNGRNIRNLGAWLWKVAKNIADDKWQSDYAHRGKFDEDSISAESDTEETDREREKHQELKEVRRKEAIRIARELLPQVGEGQVRDVIELVIDAVEDGLPDLPASSIAEALGIKKNAARTLVSRGLKRLRRLAKQEGVEIPTDLPETDMNEEEEEYDDA